MKMPTIEKQATGSKNLETNKKESKQKESNPYGIEEWAKKDFATIEQKRLRLLIT